jgi:hypothetical protein
MDDLIKALTVPFAAGFTVQRLLEIADPYTTAHIQDPLKKKEVMGEISLVIGVLLRLAARIGILTILHQAGRRKLSSAARERIAAAQRARWAKYKAKKGK